MKIWLKKDIYGDFDAVDVPENTTAEHIFFRYRDQLPYTPMAAKINNMSKTRKQNENYFSRNV